MAALVLYARQWCSAPEDVAQEALIKLAGQRRWPDNPVAWLYRAARNRAISVGRAEQRRQRHERVAGGQAAAWFVADPAGVIDGAEAARVLQALPIEEREVIVAHLWGGLTFAQVAQVAGISSSTAHRRYLTGLQTLRERLGVTCPAKENQIG